MIRSVIQSVIQSRFCRRHGRSTIRITFFAILARPVLNLKGAGHREPRKNKREELKDKVKTSR